MAVLSYERGTIMLPDNGREVKQRRNYHMTLEELKLLLQHIKERYDSKWYLMVMLQFGLGLRASEMCAMQIWDFKEQFSKVDYRCAKTNKMVYDEPIPAPLQQLIIHYISDNVHRLKDGYLFPTYTGKGHSITPKAYLDYFAKWRRGLGRRHPRFLDRYTIKDGRVRYRIGSHSLRRLHRTILRDNISDLYIVKELCNYSSYEVLDRYINTEEILQKKADYLLPIFNPVINQIEMFEHGQKRLGEFA